MAQLLLVLYQEQLTTEHWLCRVHLAFFGQGKLQAMCTWLEWALHKTMFINA